MKIGMSIEELGAELELRSSAKRDFILPTSKAEMFTDIHDPDPSGRSTIKLNQSYIKCQDYFNVDDHTHGQIASRSNIPRKHYDRLRTDHPDIFDTEINALWQREPENRMLRTMDGKARAWLSSKYRRMDNLDMANAVFPALKQFDKLEIASCQVTDKKLYIKAKMPWLRRSIDIIPGSGHKMIRNSLFEASCVWSNSEIGSGRLSINPAVYSHECTNLCIANTMAMSKYHIGRRIEEHDEPSELFSDNTRAHDDAALWGKVRDVSMASLNQATQWFDDIMDQMEAAQGDTISIDPIDVGNNLKKHLGVTEIERGAIVANFVESGRMNRFGLMNAVTATAGGQQSYDRATHLEQLGGKILELTGKDWEKIAN